MSIPDTTVYTTVEIFKAYEAVFSSLPGQLVLEDLKRVHHFYGSLITAPGPIDPMQMAIAEGERNVVLRILATLQSKESEYVRQSDARG